MTSSSDTTFLRKLLGVTDVSLIASVYDDKQYLYLKLLKLLVPVPEVLVH